MRSSLEVASCASLISDTTWRHKGGEGAEGRRGVGADERCAHKCRGLPRQEKGQGGRAAGQHGATKWYGSPAANATRWQSSRAKHKAEFILRTKHRREKEEHGQS